MEKIIIGLLSLILVLCVFGFSFILYKHNKKKEQPLSANNDEILRLQLEKLGTQLNDFKNSWHGSDKDNNAKLVTLVSDIDNFQKSLNKKEEDYKNSAEVIKMHVTNVVKDVAKLQESSIVWRNIDSSVQTLQEIFTNTKKRGNVGEYTLEKILGNMLGANQKIWQRQYQTKDGKIVDAYIKTTDGKEGIAIDAKFSIDNYQRYIDAKDPKLKQNYLKDFRNDIRKRIDEVTKYISVKNEISNAIMFIPSEEIFVFIYSHFSDDIIYDAFKKHVWITSPTTLAAVLFTVEKNNHDFQFNKNLEQLKKRIMLFKSDFDRWIDRWEEVKKEFEKTNNSINNLDITHNQLANHYINLEMFEEIKESE